MGHDKVIEMFMNRGKDVNIKDNSGETALHTGWYKTK